MPERTQIQPTLWRTCRVLANRTRLGILALLIDEPGQRVTAIADRLRLSVPATSLNLRALEARGLLRVRRSGKYVKYAVTPGSAAGHLEALLKALRLELRRGSDAVDLTYRTVTAFTHPRRVELFRQVHSGVKDPAQLRRSTRISRPALLRHGAKLENRGLIQCRQGAYEAKAPSNALQRALVQLALQSEGRAG